MYEDRDQSRGHRERNDEGKEQLHGIPRVFRERSYDLRQFREKSRAAHNHSRRNRARLARLHDIRRERLAR